MDEFQSVTLTKAEWQQLVAILANSTGWTTLNKLFQQLQQAEQRPRSPQDVEPEISEVMRRNVVR